MMDNGTNRVTCPTCGGNMTYVKDSRPHEFHGLWVIRRRRDCDKCGTRHTTVEIPEARFTSIKKEIAKRLMQKMLEEL